MLAGQTALATRLPNSTVVLARLRGDGYVFSRVHLIKGSF